MKSGKEAALYIHKIEAIFTFRLGIWLIIKFILKTTCTYMQISKTGIFMKMDKWVSAVIGRKRNAICCPLKMLSFIILTIKSKMKLD